ncbi:MAG: hypothetical protein CM15mP31_4110 [Gammaproteobacteria bacterium]|nr:MAG: hypothetical protein CM15mP31_4110 [Gammaproteobacteria bacterium]
MEGGDKGLAAMSGGMVGMGEMNFKCTNESRNGSKYTTGGPGRCKTADIMGGAPGRIRRGHDERNEFRTSISCNGNRC